MIFDINTAVDVWPFRKLRFANDPDALYAHLAKNGITGGVTRHYGAPFCADLDFINDELARSVRPGFLPSFAVRPDYRHQWKTIEAKVAALYPSFHSYRLTDPEAIEMAHALASRGTVLHIIMREEDERSHHLRCRIPPVPAADIEAFADAVPEAKIVLVNAISELPVIAKHANLYGDMASYEPFDLRKAVSDLPIDRLLFGSHTPLYVTLAALRQLEKSELSSEALAAIRSGNAAKVYGMF